MFAFLKKLFGKPEPALVPSTVPAAPRFEPTSTARAKVETPTAARADTPVTPARPKTPVTPPAKQPSAPAPPPAPAPMTFSKETVDLKLKPLWNKLSEEVTKCALNSPDSDARLCLPLNLVQVHLAKGSMKIPLAQFRQFAPAGLFAENPTNDAREVAIPLSEIVSKLKPEQLPRRAGQKRVEVPDDIESVFGPNAGKNGKLRIVHEKPKPISKPLPEAAAPAKAPAAPSLPSAPEAPAPAARVAPAAPAVAAAPLEATPGAPAVAPAVNAALSDPAAPSIAIPPPAPERETIRAPRLDPALASLRPVPQEKTLSVAFMDAAAFWSQKGRAELENLYRHSAEFPLGVIQAALKKGKVEFTWRELKPWVRLASGNSLPDLGDETKIEFPLSLIAPRFFEAQALPRPKSKIHIGDEIPDVFVKSPVAPPVAENSPAAPVPSVEANANSEEEVGSGEFGDIFGQPEKKDWSLTEVSQRTSKLPGVAGAIIATSDGLLVGGNWPEGVGGEAVAAFLPQIYTRLTTYTSELKLGNPGHFTLLVENTPLQIFKSANSYFTVLGRAGEKLPTRKLEAIATRLAAGNTETN